jgi:hypothetical protein
MARRFPLTAMAMRAARIVEHLRELLVRKTNG